MAEGSEISGEEIAAAHAAVAADVIRTPTLSLPAIDEMLGGRIGLKAENLQQTGSFKARGVSVKLASLGEECSKGVVAGTAGNHGRALAWAAKRRGIPCELFVPEDAPISKTEPAARLGASVTRCKGTVDDCVELATERAEEDGLTLVHPFDDPKVITGQAGIGLELLDQVPDLAKVLVPARRRRARLRDRDRRQAAAARGRGGRRAGRGLCRVSGLAREGRAGDRDAERDGRRRDRRQAPRRADAAAGRPVARWDHRRLRRRGRRRDGRAARRGEAGGRGSGRSRGGRARVRIRAAGGTGHHRRRPLGRQRRREAAGRDRAAQRRRHGRGAVLFTTISDRPGSLAQLLEAVGTTGASVVDVRHVREVVDLHVAETGVELILDTRDPEHTGQVIDDLSDRGYAITRQHTSERSDG